MPRTVGCPGSKLLQRSYPNTSGDEANEGTVAHGIGAVVLEGRSRPADWLGKSIDNVYVDQEMLHHVQLYVDACGIGTGFVEKSVSEDFHGNTLRGTPDYWRTHGTVLEVKDFKYGFGWVEVYENWQLLTYAALIYFKLPNPELIEIIELTVIQPRANHPDGPVRKWSFPAELIRNYRNQLINAMGDASLADPPTLTGAHCRYCRALVECHSAIAAAGYTLEYANTAGRTETTPESFSMEMETVDRAVKMLTQRKVALEEVGKNMIQLGVVLNGWERRSVSGSLAWDVDAIAVGEAMGADLSQPLKPITPTQAIARKLMSEDTVKAMSSRKPGGVQLVRVNHERDKRILTGE